MKTIFTARVALISLIFGSSGYGLKTLFPIEHCYTYLKFPYLGFIVAVLTSLLIPILIPSRIKVKSKIIYNLVFVALFFVSVISSFVFLSTYNRYTFHPQEFTPSGDSTFTMRVNDNVLFFQSGLNGLVPFLRKEIQDEGDYDAATVFRDAGGLEPYLENQIWTKASMDRSAINLLLCYFFFIISLIATTFAFLEVLKNRKYTDEIAPRKQHARKDDAAKE